MLSTAAEDETFVPEKAVSGLNGWVDCFEKASFKGSLFCGGINDMGNWPLGTGLVVHFWT